MTLRRDVILACARDLCLKEGFEGFSMRKLARCVGVTAPALYRHYSGKEEVLADLVNEAYRLFAQYLYRALEGGTPAERLRLAGKGYFDFALENPAFYEALFASPDLVGLEQFSDETQAHACAIGQFWTDRVRECMEAGILRRGDPHRVAVTLWAHSHGLMNLYLRDLLPVDEAGLRELAVTSFRFLMEGLGGERVEELMADLPGPSVSGDGAGAPAGGGGRDGVRAPAGRGERNPEGSHP